MSTAVGDAESVCGGGMGEGKREPSFAKKLQCSQQPWVDFALVLKKKKKSSFLLFAFYLPNWL